MMEIDENEAALLLKRFRADRDANRAEIADLAAMIARADALAVHAAGLDKVIDGLVQAHPALAETPSAPSRTTSLAEAATEGGDKLTDNGELPKTRRRRNMNGPRATDVVRHELSDNPFTDFTSRSMIDHFAKINIEATPTAIRLALKTAVDKGYATMRLDDDGAQVFRFKAGAE